MDKLRELLKRVMFAKHNAGMAGASGEDNPEGEAWDLGYIKALVDACGTPAPTDKHYDRFYSGYKTTMGEFERLREEGSNAEKYVGKIEKRCL